MKRERATADEVRGTFAQHIRENPTATPTLDAEEFYALPEAAQNEYQQKCRFESFTQFENAIGHAARSHGLTPDRARAIIHPAPLPEPWFLTTTTAEEVVRRADLMIELNPEREGHEHWRLAASDGRFALRMVERGHSDHAVFYAVKMMQQVFRAELIEGPAKSFAKFTTAQAKRTASLDELNERKRDAQRWCQELAAQLWISDADHAIRIGEMTDLVWSALATSVHFDCRPDTTSALREWLKPGAPAYATRGGRPPKAR